MSRGRRFGPEVNRVHINRGMLGWGVFLLVAGTVPLLVQAGTVDPEVIRRVWQLWPLILIGIGLGLILQRTRAAVVGGLVVAVTCGLLVGGWFAVGFSPGAGFGTCGLGGDAQGDPFPTQSGTLSTTASVDLDISCGDAVIAAAAGSGWSVSGTSDGGLPPTITSGQDLKVASPHRSGIDLGHASSWQVTLPQDVSIHLGLSANAGTVHADLGTTQVPNLSASVNAGSATIDMGDVTGLDTLDVSANAGSLSLTLPVPTGTVNGSISANAGSVELCVPDGVGLRITSSTSLGSNNFENRGLAHVGDTWVRPGLETSQQEIALSVSANLGNVTLNPEGGCD